MIRKLVAVGAGFLLVALLGLSVVGITPAFIIYGPGVATGIGSKLLCSAEYVIGNSREQAFDDLVQYSPILAQISYDYDDEAQSVTTTLLGFKRKTASFIPGLGCAVDYPGFDQRHELRLQQPALNPALNSTPNSTLSSTPGSNPSLAPWPAGDTVAAPDMRVQNLVESLLAEDNSAGLNTRALLVVNGGRIVAEAYGQGMDSDTPLPGWSMTKSLNAIMLGNLEMRGLIDLSAETGFAQWQNDARARIRIEDLLTMTDGLAFSERYHPGSDATAMLFTAASSSDYVLDLPAVHSPGTRFNYSSGTANILSRLYTDTLGGPQQGYDNFIREIFRPMGFQNAVFETDASGVFMGSSYFYAAARDWARMGQLMLNGGELNGYRLVTQEWVRKATTPNQSGNDKAYGYQWWLNRGNARVRFQSLPADAFFASGNREQSVMVIPSRNTAVVRLGWTAGRYPLEDRVGKILDSL